MIKKQQERFIKELALSVVAGIVSDIRKGNLPESWDGFELRQLLADRFERSTMGASFTGRRKAEYRNTVLVNDL